MKIELKQTIDSDIDFIIDLESRPENNKFVIPYTRDQHLNNIKSNSYEYLLIVNDGQPVGYIINKVDIDSKSLEIVRIIVSTKGAGIGKAAITQIIEKYINKKFKRIWLDVFEDNQTAKSLYQKIGFSITDQVKHNERNLCILEYSKIPTQPGDAAESVSY